MDGVDASLLAVVDRQLRADEGLRLFVYDDATGLPIRPGTRIVGHPTIGIGRALDVHGVSVAESGVLEDDDIATGVRALDAALPWFGTLDAVRQAVLIEMAFNLGVNGLLSFHATLGALSSGDYESAATAMGRSRWAQQLPARARKLCEQMRTGEAWT